MQALSRRSILAITAMVDIALHARPRPVSSKALAERHRLPRRHLEPVLQTLVRQGLLKGVRGPHGGYELARERRRITAGDVVRAVMANLDDDGSSFPLSRLAEMIKPLVETGAAAFLAQLDDITLEDLCSKASAESAAGGKVTSDFTI